MITNTIIINKARYARYGEELKELNNNIFASGTNSGPYDPTVKKAQYGNTTVLVKEM